MRKKVVDLFAGGGGVSAGIRGATGRSPDIAVNHWPLAIEVHKRNHPETCHFVANVYRVKPEEAVGTSPVQLLWASPDCFPAGTMILARDGYRPVEQVAVGDEVLTHLGRWRKVTATMSTIRPLVRIRGYGHPGLTLSAEHPVFTNVRGKKWNNERRTYDRFLTKPKWTAAGEVTDEHYWATPISFPEDMPPPIPVIADRRTTITPALMWLAGRYIADGWTRLTDARAELVITTGHSKVTQFRERTAEWTRAGARAGSDEMAWHERDTETAHQFSTNHRGLVMWLREQFGHGAAEKRIPGWALGMPAPLRQALLDGYLSGDGHRSEICGREVVAATTVSRALAFGLKALASSLGKSVTMTHQEHNNNVIEGRLVNALPSWQLRWRDELVDGHRQAHRESHLEWAPIRERVNLDEEAEVFNLGVEEDESYVAEGVVVHNCTTHSVAKGSKPVQQKIRMLPYSVIPWAARAKPELIIVENVQELRRWGPLIKGVDGQQRPDPAREGETFRAWIRKLEKLGYRVEHRVLTASDYGAPTRRKRLFVIARRNGGPIAWPAPTHGSPEACRANPKLKLWKTAASCIDWNLPCPSIFGRKKPLAPKTLARIFKGLKRFVLENPKPFVVGCGGRAGQSPATPIDAPLGTVTAKNDRGLVVPSLVEMNHQNTPRGVDQPLATVTTQSNRFNLLTPLLVKVNHGGVGREEARGEQIDLPLSTVTASRRGHALVAPLLVRTAHGDVDTKGKRRGQGAHSTEEPLPTQPASKDFAIAAPVMVAIDQQSSGGQTSEVNVPLHTVVAKNRSGLVTAWLAKNYGGVVGVPLDGRPLDTITAVDHHSLAAAALVKLRGECSGADPNEPAPTITASGTHLAEVRAYLTCYYSKDGSSGQMLAEPMRTITAKAKIGIVTVYGVDYQIVDIGFRMLRSHELLKATFGKYAEGYDLSDAKTEEARVRLVGNAVPPELVEALVRANVRPRARRKRVA